MRSTFWPNRIFKLQSCQDRRTGPKLSSNRENSALSIKIVQSALFQVMRSTFWPNRICERQSCQNRHTGPKFSPKRENSALLMKIVQNAVFMCCGALFGQIAFVTVKVVKIVPLAVNSFQEGKIVRFSWKLYKTLFSCHAEQVLAKSHFGASKFSKSSHWPEKLFTPCSSRRAFHAMRRRFGPNRIFQRFRA